MTSGWVCTCEGLVVDLQVDLQNDVTFKTVSFGLFRLDCFLPPPNPRQLLSLHRSIQSWVTITELSNKLAASNFENLSHIGIDETSLLRDAS